MKLKNVDILPFEFYDHLVAVEFSDMVQERQQFRVAEKAMVEARKEVDGLIGAALDTADAQSVLVGREGKYPWIVSVLHNSGRLSLNHEKVKDLLVGAGVDRIIVDRCFAEATYQGVPSTSVQVKESR